MNLTQPISETNAYKATLSFCTKHESRLLFIGRVFGVVAIIGIAISGILMTRYQKHISIWPEVVLIMISFQLTWFIPMLIDKASGIDVMLLNFILFSLCWVLLLLSGGF
jgi:hypothetical protein